ncbi:hypothetical protein AEQ27_00900 [Frigoribacterium sp. RIT-PI-h]|nr:hypothetical protein AEQ27_00900 [Frigoribacterium sp. RIT-PI-h]
MRSGQAPTVDEALDLAVELGRHGALPGLGSTADLWQALATLAAHDLGAARAVEPHLDALAILDQHAEDVAATSPETLPDEDGGEGSVLPARARTDDSFTWGVFAAEGPGVRLEGSRRSDATGAWSLTGTKPWCSLAGTVDGALVTAWVGDERRLFSVDLRQQGVTVTADAWPARGLVEIPSGPVDFDDVEAHEVGAPGWYLERPGFSWGGIGGAACWHGGAAGAARPLLAAAVTASSRAPERPADPHLLQALGLVDTRLADARRALVEAADLVDAGEATGEAGRLLAKRVRGTVAHARDEGLAPAPRALGPAPRATDAAHAKRGADLELYPRQPHGERDDASLGQTVLRDAARDGLPT